jgi:hypothetical protein
LITARPVIAVALALASTTLTNLAYLREHDAAAALPVLSMRRPLHSAHALLADRSWALGFGMETAGFILYASALKLAPLALVQSVGAGGIGILAFVSARLSGRRLGHRELAGVGIALVGLLALAVSLGRGAGADPRGRITDVLVWLAATAVVALVVLGIGRRTGGRAVAEGVAGGLFFSIGDISTKLATDGGLRFLFIGSLIAGYALGTSLLQLGYQRSNALTVAGLATLLTYAMPIAAGMTVLGEPIPHGALGAARVVALVAVTVGAFLLAHHDRTAP